ncbi:hypothetical protein AAU57_04820 [Nonlabens sp. YIK11]|uniref:lysozyme inhibitor LprI family protein n=1 Tax=Nonlabens sp. YIK11 TaxID=1453349 RepID=UPI0006DC01BD|nr:lysozyme inhibitor LprI family protein [Nonlabens sp. YIK11]KQC32716.1 hypothetical protein AAU57_04820 [Nonlabens sp. YIK11]
MNYSFVFFLGFATICFAQKADYSSLLKEMDSLNQIELNTGVDMLSTERNHFINLHEFMNEIYTDLIVQDDAQTLVADQLEWNKWYDFETNRIWNPINNSQFNEDTEPGRDRRMIAYSEQADLLRKRILELIEKF